MENNKLISEFMGYKVMAEDKFLSYDYPEDTNLNKVMIDVALKYHTSWESLKRVVDEIEMRCQGVPQELLHLSLFSPREEVYKAVVEFIKHYNQNK
tara:strand:- start:421 stop:708 length:288 start_codon:yes stop_codon:yes gene_type:complete